MRRNESIRYLYRCSGIRIQRDAQWVEVYISCFNQVEGSVKRYETEAEADKPVIGIMPRRAFSNGQRLTLRLTMLGLEES